MKRLLSSVCSAITSVIGIEEVAIYAALALIACGFWQTWKPGAVFVPGVVMLWMYIPQRKSLIERTSQPVVVRRKET